MNTYSGSLVNFKIFRILMITISFSISPIQPSSLSESQLEAFKSVVHSFPQCLVILLQFSDWDPGALEIPIVRARMSYNKTNGTVPQYSVFKFSDFKKPQGQVKASCALEFHCFPPLSQSLLREATSISALDFFYLNSFDKDFASKRLQNVHSVFRAWENLFRILLTDSEQLMDWTGWALELSESKRLQRGSASYILVMQTLNGSRSWSSYVLCDICSPCNFHFIPIPQKTLNIRELTESIDQLYKVILNVKWLVKHSSMDSKKLGESQQANMFDIRNANATVNIPFEYIIFKTAFSNVTSTWEADEKCIDDGGSILPPNTLVHPVVRRLNTYSRFGIGSMIPFVGLDTDWTYLVNVRSEGLDFVTCACAECNIELFSVEGMKLGTLFALDVPTWTLIAGFGLLMSTFFVSTVHYSSTEVILYIMMATLVEQSNNYAQNNRKRNQQALLPGNRIGYWLCGSWIIAAIIISNSYKGEYIKNLVVHRKPKLYEAFEELVTQDFTIYSIPFDVHLFMKEVLQTNRANRTKKGDYYNKISLIYSYHQLIEDTSRTHEKSFQYNMTKRIANITKVPQDYLKIYNGSKSFASLIANCSKNVAFASWSLEVDKVQTDLEKLNGSGGVVSKSRKSLYPVWKGWNILNWGSKGILRRVWSLKDSGIAEFWWKFSQKDKSPQNSDETTRQGFKSFRNIFCIFGLGLSVGILQLVVELIANFVHKHTKHYY